MKRRLFTGLAAATALAASIMITSGAAASAQDASVATAADTQSTETTGTTPQTDPAKAVAVDTTKFKISITLRGVGKQVYDCVGTTWTLREPMAGLFTSRGAPAGIHDGLPPTPPLTQPFWSNFDGSKVVGSTTAEGFAKADAPNKAKDIPWLKIPAISNAGASGAFSKVKFIQRINTRGGVAPTPSCIAPSTASVDYATDYVFWVDK